MPAYKTFASFAEKLTKALEFLDKEKLKRAVTILKRLQASAQKRSAKKGSKTTKKSGKGNPFMKFVKANFKQMQAKNPGLPPPEIMKLLSKQYKGTAATTSASSSKKKTSVSKKKSVSKKSKKTSK